MSALATEADELLLARALDAVAPLDQGAMAVATDHIARLTKPAGSLGRLEELAIQLAGITGRPDPPLDHRRLVIAAGDHGVAARGVSAYPAAVTAQMVANFVAGGAAINVLADAIGASVVVLDVGVGSSIPAVPVPGRRGGRLIGARVRDGTRDMTVGPAMTRREAVRAVGVGLRTVDELVRDDGLDVLGVGEMGIGNTTSAAAIVAALTGEPVARVTGRGTGIDDATYQRKVTAIEDSIAVNAPDRDDPIGVLAAVGGLEVAALVGLIAGAAAARVPVVLDGFITGAAALVAARLQPAIADRLIASHRSVEPGHAVVLGRLGRRPLLDLGLRLGEGTGAALAFGLLVAACRIRDGMATFQSAGVAERLRSGPG
jgi:nicotinate-nucleotide--dimethylbenzimidazole phosphoribosyltransferase